jgi:hypothetical protein
VHFEPEEDHVVRDLQPLIDHVSRIMESALDEGIDYYKQKSRRVNIQTLPDLMRDSARHLLEEHPLPAQPYELEYLSRNGLSLLCRGHYYQAYHIKIFKSDSGEVPVKRISRRREMFCCQLPLSFEMTNRSSSQDQSNILPFHSKTSISRTILNLVFTWEVDLRTGMLCLALVCPKHVETNHAVIYWEHRIEHAALRIAKEQPQPVYVEDDSSYDISLPSLGELGNGQEDD